MNTDRLLMLLGKSKYDAMNIYLRELGAAYSEMGYEVEYFDGTQDNYDDVLFELTSQNEYKAMFACNVIMTGWDKLVLKDSVFCCLMFDHPSHLYERIEVADENVVIIHCDRNDAEYIARYCTNVGSVGFVPLSGSYVEGKKDYDRRQYDIVFTGTYMKSEYEYQRCIEGLGAEEIEAVNEVISRMKKQPELTMETVLEQYFTDIGKSVTDQLFSYTMGRLCGVDTYMRAWIREQIIGAIVDSGIKLNVFGDNWNEFVCRHPENIIQMEGCGEISLQAVADAKISLNVMPWFRGGFQERIASAMLCGAVALTDSSSYIKENFIDGEDIVLYDRSKPELIPDIIKGILADSERAAAIARNGMEKAFAAHTWKHRADEVMDVIDDSISWLREVRESYVQEQIKVSVIVPVHNTEKTLVDCLGNLVNQTLDSMEIILINDCSTDRSIDILRSCQMQFPDKVFVIDLPQNLGPGGARNVGLKYVHGEYIGFVDSDDIVDIAMYEKMYNKAKEGDYDIVDVGYYNEQTHQNELYTGEESMGILDAKKRSELMIRLGGYIWSKIFKSELVLNEYPPFRENCILEDCDFLMKMYATAKSIWGIKEILYVYKYYESSISRSTEADFYCGNMIKAIQAIYARLSVMDNYEEVRKATEAVILRLYAYAINKCLIEYSNRTVVPGIPKIEELVKAKNAVVRIAYDDNEYLPRHVEKAEISIIKQIDKLYNV